MNSQVKEKWVNALRSGEYQQGAGKLRNSDGFCCLGVLCDLYSQEPFTKGWVFHGDKENALPQDYWKFDGEKEWLPKSVMEWAGLSKNNPVVDVYWEDDEGYCGNFDECISELNDASYSFTQLADIIEAQL
jgi:hypothetical protein